MAGRIALVTGASRGLGTAIAERLGRDGCRVAVNYHASGDKAKRVVEAIRAGGGVAEAFQADVFQPEGIAKLLADVGSTWGPVEILVNNATGPQPEKRLEDYVWEDFQAQLDYFVKSPVLLTQGVLPAMKQARWGRIINIVSEVAENCRPLFSVYVAAKCAQAGLTRAWALEFAPWNITVNMVNPGFIPTERHVDVPSADIEAYRKNVPMGRQGTPDEVAAAVSYFAAEESGFTTGQKVAVNGANYL